MKLLVYFLALASTFSLSAHVTKKFYNKEATKPLFTTIHIIKGDITNPSDYKTQVIVNAANEELSRGSGVCGAIFEAAEGSSKALQNYIQENYPHGIKTGEALLTPSYALENKKIKGIIHAVGPKYSFYTPIIAAQLLKETYINSLKLAAHHDFHSIAFPFISSGIYGYPKKDAAHIALNAAIEYAKNNSWPHNIYFILNNEKDYQLFKAILLEENKSTLEEDKSTFFTLKNFAYGIGFASLVVGAYYFIKFYSNKS